MKKTFLAGLMSVSLAMTGLTATTAVADQRDDIARLLVGIATVAIIANAVKNNTDRNRTDVQPHRPQPTQPQASRWVLPGECLTTVNARRGEVRMFTQRCLQENYRYANRLPNECRISVNGRSHTRVGYDPRCLRDYGYTSDRRRR
jgi:hypothetical protein